MARKLLVYAMLMAILVGCSGQADTQLLPEDNHTVAGEHFNPNNGQTIPDAESTLDDEQNPTGVPPLTEAEQSAEKLPPLTEAEQSIADVLIHVVHNLLDMRGSGEHPIIALLEDSVIEVSYVQGYFWLGWGYEDKDLLEVAPEGITCFLRPPEPAWNGPTHAVINLGISEDGTYIDHTFGFHPLGWEDVEEYLSYFIDYPPSENPVQTFTFYIPPRVDYWEVATIDAGIYESGNSRIRIEYPQIRGLLDSEDEAKLNELIRSEAMLLLSRFDPGRLEYLGLTVVFEVKLMSLKALSIVYTGYWTTAGPDIENSLFYTTNIDMRSIKKLLLDDYFLVSRRFVDVFRERRAVLVGAMAGFEYSTAFDFVFEGLSDEEIVDLLRRADSANDPNHIYSYLTQDDKLGISFGLPWDMRWHAEYEIELGRLASDLRAPGL